jgi:glycosyltransferase involved in cell wall biosynthesis
MTKKILIDMTVLAQGTRTGVFRVAHELVTRLAADPKFDVFFTLTQEAAFHQRNFDLRAGLRAYGREHDLNAPYIDAGIHPAFTDIDIYLSPFFNVPRPWAEDERVAKAVVAYDLIPVYYPEFCEDGIVDLVTGFYDHLRPDWLVFSISECTKRDLLSYRPDIPERQVIVTHLGADERFTPDAGAAHQNQVRSRHGIPSDASYVLSVATLEVRKNLACVLEGFSRYLNDSGDAGTLLVLAGMKGWKLESLEQQLRDDPRLRGRVILTGFVPDEDLPALYAGASAFVFMSHYEGFGLPPLEAMSCGVPVITSNTASLPEVVGDAAPTLAPDDVEGFATALNTILSDENHRRALSRQALAQASRFSWNRFGERVSNTLGEVRQNLQPVLSIITICFNEAQIRDTCESVKRQTFRNFEWIVIDGGSSAETLGVLEEYRDCMSVFVSEPDNGRYDAMNKGIRASRGAYLLFLNGGDYLHDDTTLSTVFSYAVPFELMDLFSLKLNAPIIYGEVIARETGMFPHPMWRTGPQAHDLAFFNGNSLPHQATFIRRDLFDRYGPYDDSLQYAADYEWFIRALCYHGVESQYLPTVVSVYNFDGVSSTSIEADAPHIVEIRNVLAHYSDPEVSVDWPHRPGAEKRTVLTLPSTPPSEEPALDQAYTDRVLKLAAGRLGGEDLKCLVRRCREMLADIEGSSGQPLGNALQNAGDVARATVALLINRLHQSVREAETVSDRVGYRRLLMRVQEQLIAEMQRRLTQGITISTGRDEDVEHHVLLKFTRQLGLQEPPLAEPEAYHLTQLALRAASRSKYVGVDGGEDRPWEKGP